MMARMSFFSSTRRLHCTPRVLRTQASIGLCALLDARRLLALASSVDEFNSCAVFARATLDDEWLSAQHEL